MRKVVDREIYIEFLSEQKCDVLFLSRPLELASLEDQTLWVSEDDVWFMECDSVPMDSRSTIEPLMGFEEEVN